MQAPCKPPIGKRLKNLVIGTARNPFDPSLYSKLSLIALFAWVGLGADALSSSSYGPSEAFLTLGGHKYLAIFVAIGTAITIFVITKSYSQIVEAFPSGGGGYVVASKLLSPTLGAVSGCALLVDYVLTITLSIACGTDALFSFFPVGWQVYKLLFAIGILSLLVLMNLRGTREAVLPLVPIFVLFIVSHVFIIIYGLVVNGPNLPAVVQNTASDVRSAGMQVGFIGVLALIMHSYSMGAGTYTGIEAVSNSTPILREPRVKTAQKTMRYMAISLSFMVIGLMVAYLLFNVTSQPGKTLNAVLFENITNSWPGSTGYYFLVAILFSEAVLLFVAAQTGFLGGPRVLANMSLDRWFPTRFANLSDRLVSQNGILIMGGAALIMMMYTHGSVQQLVVLYSITVFITFVLSQSGMVRYWWLNRSKMKNWLPKMFVNGIGLALSGFILVSVVTLKFNEGGWVTIMIAVVLLGIVFFVRGHYELTGKLIKKLDAIVPTTESCECDIIPHTRHGKTSEIKFDQNAKTAVVMVSGFNGLGLNAVSSIFKLFGDSFKNFVFIEVGIVDAGVFKGVEEMENLTAKVKSDVNRYVNFVREHGYYAESIAMAGTDVVEEVYKTAPSILERFPNAVFFGGQIVFPKDTIFTRILHNYSVFSLQRKLYRDGIPFIILPVKVE